MIVICDLDGTLTDISHRRHLVDRGKSKWDEFFKGMGEDKVNEWCKELLICMSEKYEIVYITGRPDSYRDVTIKWLRQNDIPEGRLYMRKAGDYRPDYEIKSEIYNKHLKDQEVLFVLEDRKKVVEMWRSHNLTVLQNEEGDF